MSSHGYTESLSFGGSGHIQGQQVVPFRTGSISLKLQLLHGNLVILVKEAKNLPNMDAFHKTLGDIVAKLPGTGSNKITSDPYVTVSVARAVVGRTFVISNSENPVWEQYFDVPVAHYASQVHFVVKDSDVVGSQLIGVVAIPVEQIYSGMKVEGTYPILGSNGKPCKPGAALSLSIQYIPIEKLTFNMNGVGLDPDHQGVPGTYFPVRRGGKVTLYQDAHVPDGCLPSIKLDDNVEYEHGSCWQDMFDAISQARRLIYIVGWSVYHKVRLLRDGRTDCMLGDLLKNKSQEGVRVLLLVWDDPTSTSIMGYKTDGIMQTNDEETRRFFKHSSVQVLLCPRSAGKSSWVKKQEVGTIYTHHQKTVIVDADAGQFRRKIIAFVGGLDLCLGRYDTPEHPIFRTLQTVHKDDNRNPTFSDRVVGCPRQPWHDLHSKIEGPAAYDILANFQERWLKASKPRGIQKLKGHDDALLKIERIPEIMGVADLPQPSEDDLEAWDVQVFRSIDSNSVRGFPENPKDASSMNLVCGKNVLIDMSIHAAYVKAIRAAQHFIYIENQYFLGSSYNWTLYSDLGANNLIPMEIALKIVNKIKANERFAVYIVIPMWPEGVPTSTPIQRILFWQHKTMQMMYEMIYKALLEAGLHNRYCPQDYLNFFCLGNREKPSGEESSSAKKLNEANKKEANTPQALTRKNRRFMIYVHSKGMIVDDEYVIIGSANINQRSMEGTRDTEIAMGAYQPHHTWARKLSSPHGKVYGYRMSLWAEHIGLVEKCFKQPESLECVQRVRTLSEQNWSQYIADEVTDMKGHLLKYPVEVSPTGKVEPLPGCAAFPDVGGYILGSSDVQFTELTGDFETTGDVRSMASPQPEPAPVKNDVLSGFGMEDARRGIVAHSDHELESTGISRTFRDEDHFEKGVALPSTSPVIGQKNDEFLNTRGEDNHRGFVTHLGHETQNTDENHLEEEIPVPSTSPPSPAVGDHRVKYDVFLSFRGEDTRKGFIAYLYRELQKTRAIKTFKDDAQLKKGTVIASNLLRAIEESRFAIIVFSEKYADSAWCLDELTKIFQCMEGKDTILPIFYQLDPAVVRYQKKETSFGEAFVKHEARQDIEKTNQWRAALKGVAGISGWNSNTFPTEVELIDDIVKHLLEKVLQAPTRTFGTFEATGQVMDEVMKVLKDDQVTVLGVHGVAGVGKTTMVKHVGAQAEKDGLFDRVIMVVISKSPDLQEIQGTLADSLGLKEGIKRGDRMLIILDDIWESFELSGIGIPGHHELQNCYSKVVIITRNSNVCHSMGCHAQIALNILSDEDSWKLLKETSGKSFDESANSYDEERKVAQECRGLPRAIKAAARSLGDKYRDEWNEAVAREFGGLDEWNEAAQAFNLEAEKGSFHSLEDTYHSLESDDAKSCFLLCCLFPENYDIPIEKLLKYGIGIGLFQYDSMQEARDRAHSVVKYLKASRLLLEGTKEGCVRTTDDIRNLALSEEGDGLLVKAGCELEEWPDAEAVWSQGLTWTHSWHWDCPIDTHEGYSIISLMRNKLHKLPEYLVCSKLQILLLQSNAGICDIPETFLQSPSALRVFDLSFTSISSLPQSFSFLTSLQALNLDFCSNLSEISVLGNLKKLEILSMRELPLKNLPKQIGNLTSLRKLDVTGRYLETIPSKVLSKLCRLEELHMKFQFGKWGSKIEDASEETNANFDELTSLLDLNILEVYISDATCLPQSVEYFNPNWVEFDICISRDVLLPRYDGFSRTLTLDTTINSLPDWFISVVTAKVERLEYTNCDDLNDLVGEYDHGRLFVLKYLSVNGHHKNLKEIINTMRRVSNKPVFENLEDLHLHCLYSLEELCVGELPPGSLRKLKLLKVQTCHSLVNALLPLTLLPRLQNLEKIICVHLDRMKYVFGSDEGGVDSEKIFLRKLREMRLCALEELVRICNGPAPHAIFQNLKVLAICECKELKSLFTIDVAKCLFQLEDLCIEQCPRLDRVIEASNSLNSEITLPALKRLALIDLPVLTRFCTESGNIETRCRCPSLEYLYVENCIKFSYYANFHFSKKQIHFNDQHHLSSLVKRWKEMHNQL